YPGGSAAEVSAARSTSGTGSTGVPMDRSTRPSGCARAVAPASAMVSQGKSGSCAGCLMVRLLRGQVLDPLRVVRGLADLGCAAGRAELIEEVDVGLGVVLPLVRHVVLVVDGLHRAHRLAGTTVHAL